ncbi:MAG: M23 family metallopeptidase [Nanoarchaeota archaeon]|nr:M23 family metallopeptidase [Nanoarchaeota archaeon]
MDEYPTASIVFVVLTILGLGLAMFLAIELMYNTEKPAPEKSADFYKGKQDVANAFHNLAKAYQDCVAETNCMCDIYSVYFPAKYSIRMENAGRSLKLTLMERGNPLLSETINNINTGIMKSRNDRACGMDEPIEINAEKKGWYASQGESIDRHYFLDSIEEIYKPSQGVSCIITESMIIDSNETLRSIEDYFGNLPRCTFKRKKKEELALTAFRTFVEEFNKCGEKEETCMCEFSRLSMPDEYFIKAETGDENTIFTLAKSKQGFEAEKEILKLEGEAGLMVEDKSIPEFRQEPGCIYTKDNEAGFYAGCDIAKKPAKIQAVFYDAKAGFVISNGGILRLGAERVNRANIELCSISRKKAYEYIWPADKMNNVYYAGECFGSGEEQCSKGIFIPQNPGSGVYAAEEGIVEYVGSGIIRLRHKNGVRTQYENVEADESLKARNAVTRGQKIGKASGKKGLLFSLSDNTAHAELFEDKEICRERENKAEAISVLKYGMHYLNPACYFSENIRNSIVYPKKCETIFKGCDVYGNEEQPRYDIRLKVLVMPVNWERQLSYLLYANNALDKFLKATPLADCPQRFEKAFVDGVTDFGDKWKGGSCMIEGNKNCLADALQGVKQCAEQYKERTGESFDFVVGVEDSDIANYPECNFADRGWTSENSDSAIVEAQYAADVLHELGHKFGLKDQYCDCSGTDAEDVCGFNANPNPLRKELGCGDKCCVLSEGYSPYTEGCMWCSGNLDIKAKDTNDDKMLDSGKRTVMSNLIDSESYSIDEYLLLKASTKLQCTR